MKLIDNKKIHPYLMTLFVYLSFCASGWFVSRGALAFMSYQYPAMGQTAVLFNDVLAFLVGGLIPVLVYEVIGIFTFRFSQARLGVGVDELRYALRFFYIPANLLAFLVKLVYFITPLASVYGNIVIDVVAAAIFMVLFLWYSAKHYVPKEKWGPMLYQIGGTFLLVYGLLTVAGLISGVMA